MSEHLSLTQTIKKVMPAVVSVTIAKTVEALEKEIPPELLPFVPFDKNHHLKVPRELVDSHGMVKVGGGSGFIVDPDGIVVTNRHVIADANASYTVVTDSGEKYPAEVLARDPIDDVAILRVAARGLTMVPLGDSGGAELGEEVLAIGNALGLFKNTVSAGIVSGLSRSLRAGGEGGSAGPVQELRGLIQTDAAINPGNSGGPLVNLRGEAIGINAAIVFGAQNLGFAIPINVVKRDLADLKLHGRIRRPLLGLRYLMVNDGLKAKFKLTASEGAFIIGQPPHTHAIIAGSPAAKAGLKERDVIVECNGEKMTAEHDIQDILEGREVGDELRLKVFRGKKELNLKVKLTERK